MRGSLLLGLKIVLALCLVEVALAAVLPLPTTFYEAAGEALLLAVVAAAVLYVGFLRPYVSAREAAEADLKQLSLAVENSPTSVVITDAEERITYVNPRFTELTGFGPEEVIGQTPRFQKSGRTPERVYRELWDCLGAGRVWRGEFVNQRKDGTHYHEQASIGRVTDDQGRVTGYVAVKLDVTEQHRLEDELRALATTDPLTGVLNRRRFFELAQAEFARARRYARPVAVLMIDVDRFKDINDTWGHGVGDDALRRLVASMEVGLREQDLLGRLGGEEFGVVLPETRTVAAKAVAQRLCERAASLRLEAPEGLVRLTVSIGLVVSSSGLLSLDEAMRRADRALYAAKRSGRNRVCSEQSSDGLQITAASGQRS